MTNPHDPTPAYMQIADALRAAIARGELADGDQLPSIRELVDRYGTAVGTVRQAIDQLKTEGRVIALQGRGVFVRRPRRLQRIGTDRHRITSRPAGTAPLEAEADRQGFERSSVVTEVASVPASREVADRLGVSEGESVLVRRYVLSLDGEPAQLASSYFLHALVDGTALSEPGAIVGGTHAYLRDELGHALTHAVEDLIARMPTPQETRDLRLAPGTPVVELVRTIYSSDRPVEVTVFVFAADRHTFTYTVPFK